MTRKDTHRARMKTRRAKQLARTPGFTPMLNRKIFAKVRDHMAALIVTGVPAPDAETQAWRLVAATLPRTPIGVRVHRR